MLDLAHWVLETFMKKYSFRVCQNSITFQIIYFNLSSFYKSVADKKRVDTDMWRADRIMHTPFSFIRIIIIRVKTLKIAEIFHWILFSAHIFPKFSNLSYLDFSLGLCLLGFGTAGIFSAGIFVRCQNFYTFFI